MRNTTTQARTSRRLVRALMLLVMAVLLPTMVFSQNRSLSGKVTDKVTGEEIIGATITAKGTTAATITGANGSYTLTVPANATTLEASFMGFKTVSLPIQGTVINFQLEEDAQLLDEVVAIGYGTMKRRDLTGAVSSVNATDLQKVASSNAMQVLQARVPGLDIRQSDGQAGSGLSMSVRGTRSISANNSPLILVDGVEYGSTLDINASDIESMDILKDAASTAIYGTKGANGVIIITTKRGQSGKSNVNFNAYVSSNIPTNIPQIMYGRNEVQFLLDKQNFSKNLGVYNSTGTWGTTEGSANNRDDVAAFLGSAAPTGADFIDLDVYDKGDYTNWLDIILQNGLTQNYEVSVSGGTDKTNFSISLSAMNEQGLMKNDALARYNGKATVDHRVNKYFKAGINIMYTYRSNDKRNSSVFSQAMKMTSITRPYLSDGTILGRPNSRYAAHSSPILDEKEGAWYRNQEGTRLFGSAYAEITPIKNLSYKTTLSVNRRNSREGIYQDYESVSRYQYGSSLMELNYGTTTGYTWDNTVSYNKTFGKNQLSALLGHSMTKSVIEGLAIPSSDVGAEHFVVSSFYDISKVGSVVPGSNYEKTTMLSYFGRLNYTYADKYILMATVRRDGYSALAEGHKWGNFPSIGAAWRVGDESFMDDTKTWMSNLKLRVSYGISGNAAITPYQTVPTLSDYDLYYYLGGNSINGRIPSQIGNEDVKWETTAAYNFGLDFGFFNNRISGSVDYYMTHTYDLLFPRIFPTSEVYPTVLSNIGETKGNGLEVALNTIIVKNKDFAYDINWSYSTNKDEVTVLSDDLTRNISGNTGQIVGQPLNIYYDYKLNGCWDIGEYAKYKADWEERNPGQTLNYTANGAPAGYGMPGTVKVVDTNDDGKLNDDDKVVYNRSPKHIFGMSNNFRYKNLSLSVLLYARLGGYMSYDFNGTMNYETANWANLDYWTPTNTSAKFPSGGATAALYNQYSNALKYEKADYFKIKDITLSYVLPTSWVKKAAINNVKIYGSLKNFITFSAVDNYDSERGGSISFPLAKQAVVGINVQF